MTVGTVKLFPIFAALWLLACSGEPSRELQEVALDLSGAQIEHLRASPAVAEIDPAIGRLLANGTLGRCAGDTRPGDYCAVGTCRGCYMLTGRCDENRDCIVGHAFCGGPECHP